MGVSPPTGDTAPKSLFIRTYGCQMNVWDSARIGDVLAAVGYSVVDEADGADVIVINTCHIREKAAEKVYSELGRFRQVKERRARQGSTTLIAVAGCVAQAEGAEVLARAPFVDVVVGPQTYHRLPELLAQATTMRRGVIDIDFPEDNKFDSLPAASVGGTAEFLTVQEGCDKFCTFCVVPYTRGAEASRPAKELLADVRRLAARGVREVCLLGQNVNAYHGDGPDGGTWGLGRLIRAMAEIPGIERLRYTTSHPVDMDDDLITAHGEVPALMPFLHLPVQSGSDRILAAMNRRHTAVDYLRIVDRLRRARHDLALGSDFIVGYPSETDADHKATLRLIDQVGFAQGFSFMYSRRPGTPAAEQQQVPAWVKQSRLGELQNLITEQQRAFNRRMVGKTVAVHFDGPGRKNGQLLGKSPYMQSVHAALPPSAVGGILPVTITAAYPNSLAGEAQAQ